ncbi:hypothetical protein A2U01_0084528, partial [Trifolium medium]|nr:hypothetical protein [Trifolium medium]
MPVVSKEALKEVSKEECTEVSIEVSTELVIGNMTPALYEIPYIQHMTTFMRPYIERIADVVGDGYCGYRAVAMYNKGN